MKAPNWAIIVGILMLLFGGCDLIGDVQRANSDRIIKMQEDIISNISKTVDKIEREEEFPTMSDSNNAESLLDSLNKLIEANQSDTTSNSQETGDLIESLSEMMKISDYSKKWVVRFGYIGLLVSFIYILGGIFLLIKKPFSITLAYGALALSIAFAISQIIIFSYDDSGGLISSFGSIGHSISIVLDILLIVIIISGDKSFYQEEGTA